MVGSVMMRLIVKVSLTFAIYLLFRTNLKNDLFLNPQKKKDGLDELNCHNYTAKTIYSDIAHKTTVNDKCEAGYFKCDKNVCIPWHFVCNGELNCADRTDEGPDCMNKCSCKHNGKCYLNDDKVWSCQCSPQFKGRDCELPNDSLIHSNDGHQIVMKESMFSKNRISNDETLNDGNGSIWLIMLFVIIVLFVFGVVISGYIYMYETDGRLYMMKRNLNRKFNFRNNSFRKTYDCNLPTADLLDQMECEPDDEDNSKFINQQQQQFC